MVARILTIIIICACPAIAFAQAEPAPAAPAPEGDATATPPPAEPEKVDLGPPGDLVTLKSGHVYRGLQVVKSNAAEVLLEVTPEVTISVPRRQIVTIEYDDIDPIMEREKRKAAEKAAAEVTTALFPAQKVPQALLNKLGADISTPQIVFDKRDLVEAVAELNKLPQVSGIIEIDKPISSLPQDKRQWTYSSRPGVTLALALDAMKKSFPNIATVIRNDKLVITDVETAQKLITSPEPAPPAAAPPAPGAAPAAAPANK
jgi:hypothetical protein